MFTLLFLVVSVTLLFGKDPNKQFYVITRDGIALNTLVWYPVIGESPYGTLFEQTPYGCAADIYYQIANAYGYAYMCQDVRGQHGSNGSYSFFRTTGNDTMDTISYWLDNSVNDWANGLLGIDGVSASCLTGYGTLMGVTQSGCWPDNPQCYMKYETLFYTILTGGLLFGDGLGKQTVYQGGAYRTGLISNWLKDLGQGDYISVVQSEEAWGPYWYVMEGSYENQWDILNQPLVSFAGWYDIFGQTQIDTVLAVNKSAGPYAKGQQLLIINPGGHCTSGGAIDWVYKGFALEWFLGDVLPTLMASVFEAKQNNKEYNIHDWFDWNVFFYVLGPSVEEIGLFWVKALNFPEYKYETWYLTDNFGLSKSQQGNINSTSYIYDPYNPMPTWGGNNFLLHPCGPQDQNYIESNRSDVLQFTSQVFETDFAFLGPIIVDLWVSSDAVDTDFTAKIIDIFPNGTAMLIQDDIMRMRWRNGVYATEQAANMEASQVYNIKINMGYMNYVFNKGHSLRLSISSSNYERFSVNYNSGLWVNEGDKDATTARNTVWWGGVFPSFVDLPIIDLQWLLDHQFITEDWTNPNPQINEEIIENFKKHYFDKI